MPRLGGIPSNIGWCATSGKIHQHILRLITWSIIQTWRAMSLHLPMKLFIIFDETPRRSRVTQNSFNVN
ncbi:MAG: hypothetical protein HDS84_06590 [Bacteroidales bacterium]|nr:hypothetical protein [Bacteroidales bacterium]